MIRKLALASTLFLAAAAPALGADACKIATKGDSPIVKACVKGGLPDAKKAMKEMVKAAKANGTKFDCESCHKDLDSYALKPNGSDDFQKLLAAAAPKK